MLSVGPFPVCLVVSKSDICEITAKELSEAVGAPESAIGVKCDVSDLGSIPAAVQFVEDRLGPIDVLVNNAGIAVDGLLLRLREEQLQKTMNTNLLAPIVFSREVSKSMLRRKAVGSIIMMGSIVGEVGNVGQVAYAASKAGLIGATKSLALELGKKGIRTNLIAPGFVKTDMTEGIPLERSTEDEGLPIVAVEDIASTVVYLLNTPSINGQVISVTSHKSSIHSGLI